MNSFLIKTDLLATGQSIPFTGIWTNTALGRNALIVAYVSGVPTTINLQGKSLIDGNEPIFADGGSADNYVFYSASGVSGYMSPAFLDSPIPQIRMAVSATGASRVWAYVTYQN